LVLGIDPGTAITGYGFVTDSRRGAGLQAAEYGVVRTAAGTPATDRLKQVFEDVSSLIRARRPDALAVEQLFFNRNVTTALAVGQSRGVVLLAATLAGVPVFEYTPSQVKQAVTGVGRAGKVQVAYMVQSLLARPTVPKPDDVTDALAIAICHLQSKGLQDALAGHGLAKERGRYQ
jgi:crossover junction endodeoxyribonuclease RuvC